MARRAPPCEPRLRVIRPVVLDPSEGCGLPQDYRTGSGTAFSASIAISTQDDGQTGRNDVRDDLRRGAPCLVRRVHPGEPDSRASHRRPHRRQPGARTAPTNPNLRSHPRRKIGSGADHENQRPAKTPIWLESPHVGPTWSASERARHTRPLQQDTPPSGRDSRTGQSAPSMRS